MAALGARLASEERGGSKGTVSEEAFVTAVNGALRDGGASILSLEEEDLLLLEFQAPGGRGGIYIQAFRERLREARAPASAELGASLTP